MTMSAKELGYGQSGSANFSSARDAMASPLALKLFQIDGVVGVFFGSDFITVTKSDDYAWSLLKPEIFAAIMEHFTAGGHLGPCLSAFPLCNAFLVVPKAT
jgi:Scaffold protein Nfu/NifU N terminal